MKYQPDQSIVDYNDWDLATSSVITGDFTTDSLKYGFGPTSHRAAESEPRYGVAVLRHDSMTSSHPKVSGTVHFEDTGEGLKIDYEIRGLYNGLHGFHIHEYGDLTDGCTSACAHFNPDNETHGGLNTETRHMGDLGNISSEDRVSKGSLFLPEAKLDSSKYGVLGRMVIVHADEDDLGTGGDEESLKTGNAGKRLACGVIGLSEPPQENKDAEDWLPKGNWVDLGYDNAPTTEQLKSQIEAGDHDDPYGNLGCPNCGNVDLFWKKTTSKGKTFRCLSCEWSDNYETVKSQGDITLQKFGLTVDCPLCGETISAYNRASIDSHFRKHKKEEAEAAEAPEPKVSESEWQEEVEWNDKPKKKTEPEWEDVEWESEQPRKCCECHTTEGLTTIQAGTFCWNCLPINLGAEDSWILEMYEKPNFAGNRGQINVWGEQVAPQGTIVYRAMPETDYNIALGIGYLPSASHNVGYLKKYDYAVFTSFSPTPTRFQSSQSYSEKFEMEYPIYEIDISGLQVFIVEPELGNQGAIVAVIEPISVDRITPLSWDEDYKMTLMAEDNYWAGSVAKAIVNEMGDDYYFNEDLHEYNCVHFAQEMSGYLTQDGIPHEIQSFAGYGGEVAHAWVYVPSEGEYYDAWTPYGVSDWKDLDFWETVDYTPEWLEQQTPESFEAEDNYEAKNQEYVDDLLRKYPNIPVVHAKTIHDITDTDTIYRIDFPLTMYRATSSDYGTEKIGEIGYLQGTNKNYGMYFDAHFNDGEHMKESDFATVPVRKVYGALTMGAPIKQYLPKDAGELLAIDLEGYYIISVRGDFWSRWSNKINEHAVPAILGDVQAEDVLMLFEPTMMSAEDNYDSTYGKAQAKIRRKLKNKIKQQAIMGTKAGQWSARKSQELKRQYEAACSKKGLQPYKGSKTKKQQDLSDWSKQKWKTASGKKSSITGEPYFPAQAVAALKQKNLYAKAKRQKAAATKAGKQNARYSDDIRAVVKQFRAEDSGSPTSTQLLNWITQTQVKTESYEFPSEPTNCVWCSSADIDSETPEHQEEGLIYSYVGCKDCGCIWREEYRYVDNEVIEEGEKRILKSEDEQLQIEIEGIDETYGLVSTDPEMLSLAESAVSQYLSRTDLPETFQLHTKPHFVFVSADAFGRSSHVARFRSQTSSHIPIIMLSSDAIRESADDYGVSLKTAVETTVWHELGHVLCELWDMEEIYPFESSNDEEEFAESIAESMYFQEPFQNPGV